MLIKIYGSGGALKAEIEPNESSTQSKEIGGDNVLSLTFRHWEWIEFEVNDYADFAGERYWLTEAERPKEISSVEWEYSLNLEGTESMLKRLLVLMETGGVVEPVFTLTAKPSEHVGLIVRSMNDGMNHTTNWKTGVVNGNENITIDYRGTYCDEALRQIAEKTGGEWWIEGTTVNVSRCERGDELELGYGCGLTKIEQTKADNAKLYTRLFVIGSSRNIDAGKYGSSRLHLPGGAKYVTKDTDKYGIIDHWEEEAFSGIYPRRTGTVSSVRSEERTGDDGKAFTIYYFTDSGMNFDPNDYEIGGLVKRVSFQEGSELAGIGEEEDGTYYLECNYNSATREFELITIWPFDDDTQLPGNGLVPKAGDKYILWNIRMPDQYYAMAEEELASAVSQYNAERCKDVSVWKCGTDHVWVEEHEAELYVGRRVKLVSEHYFQPSGWRSSRITKISRKVNLPSEMEIEIGDSLSEGTMTRLSGEIAEAKSYARSLSEASNFPDLVRSWDTTMPTDTNVFSARRSQQEHLSKKTNDRAKGIITFEKGIRIGDYEAGEEGGKVDEDANAELLSLVVRTMLSSAMYSHGMSGEGWKLWQAEGVSELEVDRLTVRQTMAVMELLIEKVRSVGGSLCVSAANGKIKAVEDAGEEWKITFEGENTFSAGDLMRCKTFSGGELKDYWVELSESSGAWVKALKSEFGEHLPVAGDECVLMGSRRDANRRNLIVISATEDGQPRIDVLDGVSGKSFEGCLRGRFGNLDGISDAWFGSKQPQGNGLYSDNAYLRGTFLLVTGEDVKTRFEITDGKIESMVSALRGDVMEDKGYLSNATFADGMEKWLTENDTCFFLVGNKWVWANNNVLTKKGASASVTKDMGRSVVRIQNKWIEQKNENLRVIPTMRTNAEGKKEPLPVYLSFYYRCASAGTLKVRWQGVDKTGFVNFNSMEEEEELEETAGYRQYNCDGLWNGTGDFVLEFTGEIYIYMLVLSTDKADALAYEYRTLLEQSERLVKISSAVWDKDENLLTETGLVVRPDGAGLYAQGEDGKTAIVGAYVDGKVKLTGQEILLEGEITANGKVKIHEDGTLEAVNGKFTGEIHSESGEIGGFEISSNMIRAEGGWGAGTQFFLHSSGNGFIGYSGPTKWAGMGLNVMPAAYGASYMMRIEDSSATPVGSLNGGLYINITGSSGDNIGIMMKGDLRVNSTGRNVLNGVNVINSAKELWVATDMNEQGSFTTYMKGVSFDYGDYDLDKVRIAVRNGLIVGVMHE